MNKIISTEQVQKTAQKLQRENKKIALAGGCFDVLHAGHIKYLNDAKKKSDILFVLLESDESISKLKGGNRPLNNQKNRSIVLSALSSVDYIIPLMGVTNEKEYDKLIVQIKPAYIVITAGDKNTSQRLDQCKMIDAKLVEIEKLENFSSSNYIESI